MTSTNNLHAIKISVGTHSPAGKESDERSTAGVTTTIHLTRYLKVLQGSDSSLRVLKER